MPFDPSTAQLVTSSPSKSFDPSTAQPVSEPITAKSAVDTGADAIISGVSSIRGGLLDSVGDMGTLAANVLKFGLNHAGDSGKELAKGVQVVQDTAGKYYGKAKDFVNSNPIDLQAQQRFPVTSAIGKGLGYVGGSLAASAPILGPINTATETGLNAVAPTLAQSPILKGIVSQGLQGGVIGAANDPQHPIQGALAAGALTAPFGAVSGALGAKLARSSNIVNFETKNLIDAGVNPASVEGITRISKSLKNNGVDFSQQNVQRQISTSLQNQISEINPLVNLRQTPLETIAQLGKTKFDQVAEEVKVGFAPIRANTQQFSTPVFTTALTNLDKKVSLPLPRQNMPENPTINDMWNYRGQLDDIAQSIRARVSAGTAKALEKSDLLTINNLRSKLTEDMINATEQVGLKDQFLTTEQKYIQEYLPFKAFNTGSGSLTSPEDINDAMNTLNKMFQARNIDINELNKIAKSLGPDGQELVGHAMLQYYFNKSITDKGLIDFDVTSPKNFFTNLKKLMVTGIGKKVWGAKTQETARGLATIIGGADEALKLGSIQDATSFYSKIPSLLGNRFGIQMLRYMGNPSTPMKTVRAMTQKLITGTLAVGSSEAQQTQDSEPSP